VVAVTAWHLALSNLIGVDVPHDLLALWLFPERGGVVLLAPHELGQDNLELAQPSPFVSQHDLFLLEERIRQAGYRSVLAVPIRVAGGDLGLAVFAHLQPARFGATEAMRLTAMMRQVVPTFAGLASAPPLAFASGAAAHVTATNAPEAVARAAAEGESGAEVLRLVSGVLQVLVPHDRLDVAIPGQNPGTWALLSGAPDGQRWGESTSEVSQLVTGFVARAAEDDTIDIGDLRPLGLAWPADVYSLSHIAIPFPTSDLVYGRDEIANPSQLIRLGVLSPRGERAVLSVPSDTLMRLTCNPFFEYMEGRLTAWLTGTK